MAKELSQLIESKTNLDARLQVRKKILMQIYQRTTEAINYLFSIPDKIKYRIFLGPEHYPNH